jgi:glycogen operon protein
MLEAGWRVRPGQPSPLGATVLPVGVNFAVYSRGERVQLCLFDQPRGPEMLCVDLPGRTGHVWHGFLPDAVAGQLYGFRVHGPFDPPSGKRFNPSKLLIDPYARALAGKVDWDTDPALLIDGETAHEEDNAHVVPKSVICSNGFDWQGDAPPRTPWQDTVIYETHVKGFSVRHSHVPAALRGTFLGLASEVSILYFRRLGITAVELMPVTVTAGSRRLHGLGLTDYWGYGPIAHFAPDARYSVSGDRGAQVTEFRYMVRELHRNGIEVILDTVFNHTAEADHTGPTLVYRGVDNATYYRLEPTNPARYTNFTGTGNTLNLHEPAVMRLVLDALRYWVEEMHVDGFRFDLAATLGRRQLDFDPRSSFLDAIYQDPVLSQVKLIAEPWDLGPDGYALGRFPAPWSEWNDRYRDEVRRYWRGDETQASQIAWRLTGSPDLFATDERTTRASINFVTSHDGFTLHDLVSYARKHNTANGEEERDGAGENYSQNFGIEGPATEPAIRAEREQQKRNFLATLLFSQGVPMLLGGDEIGRTQGGNNNPYNQDNLTSWYDWDLDEDRRRLLEFTSHLIAIRRRHPNLRRQAFLDGRLHEHGDHLPLRWLREDGQEMTDGEWHTPWYRCFGLHLGGDIEELDADGERLRDDPMLIILNASERPVDFALPDRSWSVVVDTSRPDVPEDAETYAGGETYPVAARSLALLRGFEPLTLPST